MGNTTLFGLSIEDTYTHSLTFAARKYVEYKVYKYVFNNQRYFNDIHLNNNNNNGIDTHEKSQSRNGVFIIFVERLSHGRLFMEILFRWKICI